VNNCSQQKGLTSAALAGMMIFVRNRFFIILAMTALLFVAHAQQPLRPTRADAIGKTDHLSPVLRAAFEDDALFFESIHKTGSRDWLAQHTEAGQTYPNYLEILEVLKPPPERRKLYILPLGDFKTSTAPSLAKLAGYCSAYFAMQTQITGVEPLNRLRVKCRINDYTHKPQLLTTDILDWLDRRKPRDAYAVIAVTMEDLYPGDGWNFVFGEANLHGGSGVFSFARYNPAFFGEPVDGHTPQLVLERSAKVLTHEMGHMFGIEHCVFFECNMNGANHLEESDRTPFHLCPVCLRKLHAAVGFDVLEREKKLLGILEQYKFADEAFWTRRRVNKLEVALPK
jgi:archaemetzincin